MSIICTFVPVTKHEEKRGKEVEESLVEVEKESQREVMIKLGETEGSRRQITCLLYIFHRLHVTKCVSRLQSVFRHCNKFRYNRHTFHQVKNYAVNQKQPNLCVVIIIH